MFMQKIYERVKRRKAYSLKVTFFKLEKAKHIRKYQKHF